jgi:hypothetical protein
VNREKQRFEVELRVTVIKRFATVHHLILLVVDVVKRETTIASLLFFTP